MSLGCPYRLPFTIQSTKILNWNMLHTVLHSTIKWWWRLTGTKPKSRISFTSFCELCTSQRQQHAAWHPGVSLWPPPPPSSLLTHHRPAAGKGNSWSRQVTSVAHFISPSLSLKVQFSSFAPALLLITYSTSSPPGISTCPPPLTSPQHSIPSICPFFELFHLLRQAPSSAPIPF